MRSPPPCIAPRIIPLSNTKKRHTDDDSVSVCSSVGSVNQSRPGLSFAPPAWGNGSSERTQSVRVVARIGPCNNSSARTVYVLSPDENVAGTQTAFDSPEKTDKGSSANVADLVSIFNSPEAKPIAPAFLSPGAETPQHINGGARHRNGAVRVRQSMIQPPTPSRDLADSAKGVIENICGTVPQTILAGDKSFSFDAAVDVESSQEDVYRFSVGDAIRRNIFRGFNTTVMTYGQRKSGKTYTMYGSKKNIDPNIPDDASIRTEDPYGSHENDGIVPRAIQDLFRAKDTQMTGGDVILNMSFLEIYNDGIIDLLTCRREKSSSLSIRDNGDSAGLPVRGLTTIRIKSTSHARHILEAAQKRRVSSTRSHTICTINAVIHPAVKKSVTSGKHASMTATTDVITAKLTLVDLAGTERSRTENSSKGKEQKENSSISKDLFVLGQCIKALSDVRKGESKVHVPYRDCKLTRLLRESLGGNCYTVMIACVNPNEADSDETIATLKYAELARNISNRVRMNRSKSIGLTPVEGAALRRENKVLKSHMLDMTRKLQMMRRGQTSGPVDNETEVVIDFGNLTFCSPRSFKPVEPSIDSKRWRLKYEKLLKICKESKIMIDDQDISINDTDESLLQSHLREVQELQEQINQLVKYDDDCISTTSGLTADFDDHSIVSNLTMISLSQQSLKTCDTLENMKSMEMEERKKMNEVNTVVTEPSSAFESRRIVECTEKITKLEEKEHEMNAKIQELCEKKEEFEASIQISKERLESMDSHLAKLSKDIKTLSEEKMKLCQEVEEFQDMQSLIADLSLERTERCKLEMELKAMTEHLNNSKVPIEEAIQNVSDGVEAPDDEKEDELTRLRQKIQSLENSSALATLQDKDEEIKELREKNRSLEAITSAFGKEKPVDSYVLELKGKIQELEERIEKQQMLNTHVLQDKTHDKPPLPQGKKRKPTVQNNATASPKCFSSAASVISVSNLLKDYEDTDEDSQIFGLLGNGKQIHLSDKEKLALDAFNASFDQNNIAISSYDEGSYECKEDASLSSEHRAIRLHAQKLLSYANKAVSSKVSDSFSIASDGDKENVSFNTSFHDAADSHLNTSMNASFSVNGKGSGSSAKFTVGCICTSSIFSGNADHVEFFLPRLGMVCTCGAEEKAKNRYQDPTSLQAFLRTWQVSFLGEIGIFTAKDLIFRQKKDANDMARSLKKYRHLKKMKPVRTKSCLIALQIWSKTAQTVLHSNNSDIVRQGAEVKAGNFKPTNFCMKPSLLEIDMNNNDDVSVMSMELHLFEGEYEV